MYLYLYLYCPNVRRSHTVDNLTKKHSCTFALFGCTAGCCPTRSAACGSALSPARRTKLSAAECSSPRVKVVVFLTIRVVTDRVPELCLRDVLVVSTVEPSTSVLSCRRVYTACRSLMSCWGIIPPLTSSLSPPSRVPCTNSRVEPPLPFVNRYRDMFPSQGAPKHRYGRHHSLQVAFLYINILHVTQLLQITLTSVFTIKIPTVN
jgi:hypothetical protein